MTELPKSKSDGDASGDVADRAGNAATPSVSTEVADDTVVQLSSIGGVKQPEKPSIGHGRPTSLSKKGSNAAKLGLRPEPADAPPKPTIPKPVNRHTIAEDLDAAFGKQGEAKPSPDAGKAQSAPADSPSDKAAVTKPVKPGNSAAPKPQPGVVPAATARPTMAMPAPTPAPAARESVTAPISAVAAAPAPRPTVSNPRRTRKARLRVARVDPWSVMKTVFLFSIAFGIMAWVATYLLWQILLASGLFAALNDAIVTVISSPNNTEGWRIEDYLSANKVLGVTALLAVINVIITTALGTLGAFLYNLSANILGGLELTLAED